MLRTRTALSTASVLLLALMTWPAASSTPSAPRAPLPVTASEWLAGDLHVHTCYSHDTYCPRGQKGSYFEEPTNSPLDPLLGPVGAALPGEALDDAGLGDSNTDAKDFYTLGSTVTERFAEAALKGLDYLAITDHSSSSNPGHDGSISVHDPGFGTSGVLGVPGYENSIRGHAQMLGATHLYDPGTQSAADINAMAEKLRADGGLLQANHPADSASRPTTCSDTTGQNWSYEFDVKVETVEVWNVGHFLQPPAPASQTNDDAITYWECMLSKGWRVAPTGGSDSHWKSTTAVQGIGNPTTWVFAQDRSTRGILDGLKAGRTAITFATPVTGAVPLVLEGDVDRDGVFEAMVGDTVPPGTPLRVHAPGSVATGLAHVRANGRTIINGAPLAPGASIAFTLDQPGWVWAQLTGEDTRPQRRTACDPSQGTRTTYCRNQLNVLAMTAAMYVATAPVVEPPDPCPVGTSPKPRPTRNPHEDTCKKD